MDNISLFSVYVKVGPFKLEIVGLICFQNFYCIKTKLVHLIQDFETQHYVTMYYELLKLPIAKKWYEFELLTSMNSILYVATFTPYLFAILFCSYIHPGNDYLCIAVTSY